MTQSVCTDQDRGPHNTFVLGRNSRGEWVIRETRGLMGGVFAQRKDALRFAFGESGLPYAAIVAIPRVVELDGLQ